MSQNFPFNYSEYFEMKYVLNIIYLYIDRTINW